MVIIHSRGYIMTLPIIVANWKMYFSYTQALDFIKNYCRELVALGQQHDRLIILCPSFEILQSITQLMQSTPSVVFGAQDCSAHQFGAHTGQVSALSLAQLGCSYCIVGHSERRSEYGETSDLIAQKVERLLEQNIMPIVCIGEDEYTYRTGKVYVLLEQQLRPVLEKAHRNSTCIYYAYEPIWAIGSGIVPDEACLKSIFSWLAKYLSMSGQSFKLLYGGSVTAATLPMLVTIRELDGVLVGGASVDFQKFKNIVSWNK